MINQIINPLYVFRNIPECIQNYIKTFLIHPITENRRFLKTRILSRNLKILNNLEIEGNIHYYLKISDNIVLLPCEENFWEKYISNLINNKIIYLKTSPNIDKMLLNLGIIYNSVNYQYLNELKAVLEKIDN